MTFEYVEESTSESDDYVERYLRLDALKLAIQVVGVNVNNGRTVPPGWLYDRADEYAAYIRDGSHPARDPERESP